MPQSSDEDDVECTATRRPLYGNLGRGAAVGALTGLITLECAAVVLNLIQFIIVGPNSTTLLLIPMVSIAGTLGALLGSLSGLAAAVIPRLVRERTAVVVFGALAALVIYFLGTVLLVSLLLPIQPPSTMVMLSFPMGALGVPSGMMAAAWVTRRAPATRGAS